MTVQSEGLRVLHCIPTISSRNGGPVRALVEMICALRTVAPDVRVDVVANDHELDAPWEAAMRARLPEGVGLFVFPRTTARYRDWSFGLARWLWKNIATYDVVHIHSLFNLTSSYAAWLAGRRGVRYIVRPLGTLSPYTFGHRRTIAKRLYFRAIDRPLLERAALVHFTAPNEERKAQILGVPYCAAVVPLPYKSGARPTAIRKPHQTLFLSRLHPVKGVELLLAAFAAVTKRCPDSSLVIAGQGDASYEQTLRAQCEQLGISGHVTFVGFVEGGQKRRLLEESALFVLPSHQENFGMAVVEALDAELPVVITNNVDLWPDVVRYDSGVIVTADGNILADAMTSLLGDKSRREWLGENGRRQVRELYAPNVVGESLLAMYRRANDRQPGD